MTKTLLPTSKPYVELLTPQGLSCYPVTNIYGIGRNYVAHAAELGNAVPTDPIIFMKPTTALVHEPDTIIFPPTSEDIHFEAELVLLMSDNIPDEITTANALTAIAGYGLGLDLTDRERQTHLKQHALPWTLAKGFKGSAPISQFIMSESVTDIHPLHFTLTINGQLRQHGDPTYMIFSIPMLLHYLHEHIGLQAGDLIFTGTPAGVGPLKSGDELVLALTHYPLQAVFHVA